MPNRPTVLRTTRPSAKIVLCNTEKANLLTSDSYLLTLDAIECMYLRRPIASKRASKTIPDDQDITFELPRKEEARKQDSFQLRLHQQMIDNPQRAGLHLRLITRVNTRNRVSRVPRNPMGSLVSTSSAQ
jgi:hypothetical protein